MKYGILLNNRTDNIGDDIQSYAACRFLPSIDYYVDRENLDTFGYGEIEEPVTVIMNAWYMYNKFNWPPAGIINPLFISVHFSERDYYGIKDKYLDTIGGDYLRHYAPIGARDDATRDILIRTGIESYYSGCLTLTLDIPNVTGKEEETILVDLSEEDESAIREEYPSYDFGNATHILNPNIYQNVSPDIRMKNVEELLARYKRSKCVITSRMHCALPCLALGTPVLLVYKQENLNRFSSFLPLLHSAESGTLKQIRTFFDIANPPENPNTFLQLRSNLENRCRDFIANSEKGIYPQSFNVPLEDIHLWQKQIMKGSDLSIRNTVDDLTKWIHTLEEIRDWNAKQLENANRQLARYYKIRDILGMGENGLINKLLCRIKK